MYLVNQVYSFMYEHCMGVGSEKKVNQEKFRATLTGVLDKTTLRVRGEDELWALMWDKPIYANQNANKATEIIDRCVAGHVFDDYKCIPGDSDGKTLAGLRAPTEKLLRIRRLAKIFPRIHKLHNDAVGILEDWDRKNCQDSRLENFDAIRNLIGVPPLKNSRGSIYGELHELRGFGGITELHMLMDFGFPVCKPDIWVARTTQAYAEILADRHKDALESFVRARYRKFEVATLTQARLAQHPEYAFAIIDFLIRTQLDLQDQLLSTHGIDLQTRFRAHRFADIVIAKFGMDPERAFGLVRAPIDLLSSGAYYDRKLAGRHPILAKLANQIIAIKQQSSKARKAPKTDVK